MRKGDWLIAGLIALVVVFAVGRGVYMAFNPLKDAGIPFYSTASYEQQKKASDMYRDLGCRNCHSLWAVKNIYETVPAPSLDGIGSLRSEQWLYDYFSAENPQSILPTRLKAKYAMPSYAHLSEEERKFMAMYFSSLRVQDWYLEEVKAAEYKKLTGKSYPKAASH